MPKIISAPNAAPPPPADPRHRLLDAMAQTVARKGYAETTIADLAAAARVSRRTFYEHFDDKAGCLIALYEAASSQALGVLRAAIDPARDWHIQVEAALAAYFACLSGNPKLLRTLFIEILALGPVGLTARRRVNDRLAQFILDVINCADTKPARSEPLSPALAMGIVGAINELVLHAIEDDRADQLTALTPTAAQIARSVIDG